VVVYLHGYGVFAPALYDALLRHLARKGHVVVFPVFGGLFDTDEYEHNARNAVAAALAELEAGTDRTRFNGQLAWVAHSLGGALALRIAAQPEVAPRLPAPGGIVLHDPAGSSLAGYDLTPEVLAGIPEDTRLLVIQAEASIGQENSDALTAFTNTSSIPADRKNVLLVHSDAHGAPALVSDHLGVQAGQDLFGVRSLDAIDWWGYARPTEGALLEVFGRPFAGYSAFCREAGPVCDAVRDAGRWSDGVPVKPIENAGDLEL
jgi:hypothetical protein